MTKKLSKKIMSLFISLAILVGCVSVIGIGSAFASDFKEGTYTGDVSNYIEAMGGINTNYSISISFVDGDYTYDVKVQVPMMGYDDYDDTETGTYTVNGDNIVFNGGNLTSAKITDEGKIVITGILSSFASSTSSAELSMTSEDKPSTGAVYEDKLVSGKYELTKDSYPESAMMKMDAIITIDREAKVFSTQRNGAEKGTGTISFDEYTGVYTVNYTEVAPEGATVTFTYDENGITFTSPLYFGSVRMNTLDDDGNFAPYTANLIKDVTSPDDTDVTKPDDTDVTKPDDTDVTAPDNSSTADDNNTDVATPDNSDADAADNTVDNSNKAGNATSPATGNSFSTQALIVLVVLCGMSLASVVVLFDRKKKALNK